MVGQVSRGARSPRRGAPAPCLGGSGAPPHRSATAVGCGESDAEKAQTQVCDARADAKQQVDSLAGLTVTTATVDGVRESLDAIKEDVNQIVDAQGDLNEERKQQVESATQEFTSELEAVAGGLASNSLSQRGRGPRWRLRPAAGELLPADPRWDRLRLRITPSG